MRFFFSIVAFAACAAAQINLNVQTFPFAGIASGQTARLNALNVGVQAPALGVTCSAQLSFFDNQGGLLKSSTVTVIPGRGMSIDLDADADLKLAPGERRQIRGVISIPPAVDVPAGTPSCSLTPSLEIFDRATGRTEIILTSVQTVPQILRPSARP